MGKDNMDDPNTFTITPDEPVMYLPKDMNIIWPKGFVLVGQELVPNKPNHFLGQIVDYFPLPDEHVTYPVAAMIVEWDNGKDSLGTAIGLNIFFPNGYIGYKPTVEKGNNPGQWNFKE